MGKTSHLKDSYPVELAEYAKARGIDNEPAFAWWVPTTIRRRSAVLSAVKARFQKKSHKFVIELPTSINHARELDEVKENNLWMEALTKELKRSLKLGYVGTSARPMLTTLPGSRMRGAIRSTNKGNVQQWDCI
jgi:hypothetical protein